MQDAFLLYINGIWYPFLCFRNKTNNK